MSDTFFGFDTNAPDLGDVGCGNLEEDEIDLMNDETFGDAATADDWEQEHEKLKDVVEGVRGEFHNGQPHMGGSDLERKLGQLVVDDDDHGKPIPGKRVADLAHLFGPSSPPALINTDELVGGKENIWGSPAKENYLRGQFMTPNILHQLPLSSSNDEGLKHLLHQLHQPPQPFQDPTIISTGQILSRSVPSAPINSLSDIERSMMANPIIGTPGTSLPGFNAATPQNVTPRAMTVEELERQLVGGANVGGAHEQRRGSGDTGLHHKKIDMIGSGPVHILKRTSPPPGYIPMPIGTPPRHHLPLQQHVVLPRVPVPGSLPSGAPPPPSSATPPQSMAPPPQSVAPPSGVPVELLKRVSPPASTDITPTTILKRVSPPQVTGGQGDGPHVTPLNQQQRMTGSPVMTSDGYKHHHHHHHHHQSPAPPHSPFIRPPPQQQLFPPRGPRPRFHGPFNQMPPGPHPNFRGGNYDGYPRGNFRGRGRGQGRGGHPRGGYHYHRDYDCWHEAEEEGDHDEYAGLMSEREKDWVIKIQLRQLQTDNPYLDDFYYTSVQMKKLAQLRTEKEMGKTSAADTKLVIPQIACQDSNKAYVPLQFEGSLGRLTASSVHNPRRIIDIRGAGLHEQEEHRSGKEGGRRFKQLLISVEHGYDTLLDVDELEKRSLALPEDRRESVMVERKQKVEQLYVSIMAAAEQPDVFSRLLAIRKGAKLVARLLPLLTKDECNKLLVHLLSNLHNLSKKDWHRDVWLILLDNMGRVFRNSDLETLAHCAQLITQTKDAKKDASNKMTALLQNALSASLVWMLVSRAETVYTIVSPVDMEVQHQEIWSEFVQHITTALESMETEKLAKPLPGGQYSNLTQHLKRFCDSLQFESVEEKLSTVALGVSNT